MIDRHAAKIQVLDYKRHRSRHGKTRGAKEPFARKLPDRAEPQARNSRKVCRQTILRLEAKQARNLADTPVDLATVQSTVGQAPE